MESGIVTLQSILRAEKDCATATHPSEMGVTLKRRMLTLMGLRRDRNPYNCVETVFSIVGYGTSCLGTDPQKCNLNTEKHV